MCAETDQAVAASLFGAGRSHAAMSRRPQTSKRSVLAGTDARRRGPERTATERRRVQRQEGVLVLGEYWHVRRRPFPAAAFIRERSERAKAGKSLREARWLGVGGGLR